MRSNRIIRNMLIFTFTVILISSSCCLSALAEAVNSKQKDNSYEFTIKDDFADDSVLVVFTQEASMQFKEYTPADFSEIGCINVEGLATAKFNRGKQALETATDAIRNGKKPIIDETLDLSDYNNIVSLKLEQPGKQNVLNAIKELKKRDDVLFAEPNYTMHLLSGESTNTIATTEDDELYYKTLLGLSDETNGRDARRLVDFEDPITIGIIDSGIDKSREFRFLVSLESVNFTNYSEYDPEEDYVPSTLENSIDVNGHGTHVAGIIASTVDDSFFFGMENYGCATNFLSVRAFDEDGEAGIENIVCAINYLSEKGVPIINFSAGAYLPFQYSYEDSSLKSAIQNYDGLFVCAAGNGDDYDRPVNLDTSPFFPAAWTDLDNLITVGASDADDEIYSSSNYGKNTVDIFAPGEDIYSCYPIGNNFCSEDSDSCEKADTHVSRGYHVLSGTSMSTGFVTGVAALVIQAYNETYTGDYPEITPEDIKDIIMLSANKYRAAFENQCVSNGRLDAYAAVEKAKNWICLHDSEYCVMVNSTYHEWRCTECDEWLSNDNHYYYMEEDNGEDGCVISCYSCTYSFECPEAPEYDGYPAGHHISCPNGCYSLFEDHNCTYSNSGSDSHTAMCVNCGYEYTEAHNMYYAKILGDLYNHSVRCNLCDYSYSEGHLWVWHGTTQLYVCSYCGYTTDDDYVPGIMSLPDPELEAYLASLSVEELEEFIASLPEDQVARVTALLPSEDDHLTE